MKAKKPPRSAATRTARSREAGEKRADVARRGRREPKAASAEAPPRGRKQTRDGRPARPARSAPRTTPTARPVDTPARPKSAGQAKARAKARKAKAPKVVRPPLKQRILVRLASIDLHPRRLAARVPFVVLVIAALGVGLGVTLWLSTDAAERSYQLGNQRELNQALLQQKEALERDVLEAQAAPALAEAARELGMIPSRDTAHLVQDAAGNWVVVGTPKPAEGVPPPPLNAPLPAPAPPARPAPRVVEPREVPVRLPSAATPPAVTAPVVPMAAPVDPMAIPAPTPVPGAEVPHVLTGTAPAPGPVVLPEMPAVPALAPAPPVAPIAPAAPLEQPHLPAMPAPLGAPA